MHIETSIYVDGISATCIWSNRIGRCIRSVMHAALSGASSVINSPRSRHRQIVDVSPIDSSTSEILFHRLLNLPPQHRIALGVQVDVITTLVQCAPWLGAGSDSHEVWVQLRTVSSSNLDNRPPQIDNGELPSDPWVL